MYNRIRSLNVQSNLICYNHIYVEIGVSALALTLWFRIHFFYCRLVKDINFVYNFYVKCYAANSSWCLRSHSESRWRLEPALGSRRRLGTRPDHEIMFGYVLSRDDVSCQHSDRDDAWNRIRITKLYSCVFAFFCLMIAWLSRCYWLHRGLPVSSRAVGPSGRPSTARQCKQSKTTEAADEIINCLIQSLMSILITTLRRPWSCTIYRIRRYILSPLRV